jgi:hypothetical protein
VTTIPTVKEQHMSSHCREPRLKEVLADSIVQAMMEADGVDQRELEAELRQTAALLRATQHALRSWDPWGYSAADAAKSTRTTRSGLRSVSSLTPRSRSR